jgi:hypothetical protein
MLSLEVGLDRFDQLLASLKAFGRLGRLDDMFADVIFDHFAHQATWRHGPRRLLHDCHITMPFRAKLSYPSQQLRIICNDGGMAPLDLASDRRNGVEPGDELARPIYLEQDDLSSNRHPALICCLSMIFSENRFPLFRIML